MGVPLSSRPVRALLLGAMAVLCGCSSPPPSITVNPEALGSVHRIAVLPFRDAPGAEAGYSGSVVSGAVVEGLVGEKGIAVIERENVKEIMREERLKVGDLTDRSLASEIARAAGADAIVSGSVSEYRTGDIPIFIGVAMWNQDVYRVGVNLRLVHVNNRQVGFSGSYRANSYQSYEEATRRAVAPLVEALTKTVKENQDKSPPPPDVAPSKNPVVWTAGAGRRAWLLAVGVTKYARESVPPLKYASADANRVSHWFEKPEGAASPARNRHLLVDEQATREKVLSGIRWLVTHAMPEDLVVVYFACHGAPELAPDGSGVDARYLVLFDTDPDNLYATGLRLDDLGHRLNDVQANVQVVVLEACYAGPVGARIREKTPTADLTVRPRLIQEMGARKRRLILSASSGGQMAVGADSLQEGGRVEVVDGAIFTHFLLKSLGAGGGLLIRDCFPDARENTRRAARLLGTSQDPQWHGDSSVDVVFRITQGR